MQASLSTDADLVRQIKLDQNNAAISQLYSRYFPRLFQYCLKLTSDKEAAFDIAQDVFINALDKIGQLREEQFFQFWIFRSVKNECMDHLKTSACVKLDDVAPLVCGIRAEEEDEQIQLQDHEMHYAQLLDAATRLPLNMRDIFRMKYLESKSLKEISTSTNLTISAVKMRLARARHKLEETCSFAALYN
ncbi:MAG: RNA polymerase sigma factor [Saprospiraceae bacterium]|nr:RNA polymerase sigma factor [Saprospiraceae bacterium]MCB9319617.1 RNA polymerase sigma factor [Lewinellaceae bacterium]